jgi:outer membrane protein assembly factor BamE (lipoprotein component of BamABCDE complex)
MTRRRLLVFGLLATMTGLGVLGVGGWLLWPRTAITRENAAKIREGMTLAEVEAILGGPPRDETTGPIRFDEVTPVRDESRKWWSDRVCIQVIFDENGRVMNADSDSLHRVGPLDMLRRWLHL